MNFITCKIQTRHKTASQSLSSTKRMIMFELLPPEIFVEILTYLPLKIGLEYLKIYIKRDVKTYTSQYFRKCFPYISTYVDPDNIDTVLNELVTLDKINMVDLAIILKYVYNKYTEYIVDLRLLG